MKKTVHQSHLEAKRHDECVLKGVSLIIIHSATIPPFGDCPGHAAYRGRLPPGNSAPSGDRQGCGDVGASVSRDRGGRGLAPVLRRSCDHLLLLWGHFSGSEAAVLRRSYAVAARYKSAEETFTVQVKGGGGDL